MALLRSSGTHDPITLFARHVVGRSSTADLRLQDPLVSAHHAQFYWADGKWRIRDLGSRNGTWIDGFRLDKGAESTIPPGAALAFGNPPHTWTLESVEPPVAACVGPDGEARFATNGLLAVPNETEPDVTVYAHEGVWWIEDHAHETSPRPCQDDERFHLQGLTWRVICPSPEQTAGDVPSHSTHELRIVRPLSRSIFRFLVSQDYEHVAIRAMCGGVAVHLDPRAPNHVLLQLANRRLRDRTLGRSPDEEGWVSIDDLARDLRSSPNDVNTWIFRARRLVANAGIDGAARVVERRGGEGQVRLGVADLEIERAPPADKV
jgi:hypothetical protein